MLVSKFSSPWTFCRTQSSCASSVWIHQLPYQCLFPHKLLRSFHAYQSQRTLRIQWIELCFEPEEIDDTHADACAGAEGSCELSLVDRCIHLDTRRAPLGILGSWWELCAICWYDPSTHQWRTWSSLHTHTLYSYVGFLTHFGFLSKCGKFVVL